MPDQAETLFPMAERPTTRDIARKVKDGGGAQALDEAQRRADEATYQEIQCRSALNAVAGMPFKWTLNPYRGCTHGCHYCFARRYHAQFELGAGDDFASVILVKTNLLDVLRRELDRPSWAREVGGPNTPGPGGESSAILRLAAGRYAMICVIPSSDGKPHVMKGMAKEVVVTPAASNTASANLRIGATMTLLDYAFKLSQPLQAGRQTIRVRNDAAQGHEVVVVRLQPGKSPTDMLAWMEKMEGPPPAAPIGGSTPMAHGEENLITIDFTPGEYGLICFAPDAKDGKPHFMHGMVTQFTIPAGR